MPRVGSHPTESADPDIARVAQAAVEPARGGRASLPAGPRVLVAAAERACRLPVSAALAAEGYHVVECSTGRDVLRLCATRCPDVVVLALEAGALGGLELLRHLRHCSDVPVVALGADDDATAIRALDLGADDYARTGCAPALLLARLRAILRRQGSAEPRAREVLVAGEVTVDFGCQRLFRRGREIALRPTEWRLLVELARNPGRLLPHEELLARAWGPEYRQDRSYLRVGIRRLRDKLEDAADAPRYIRTVPGRGYLFEPDGDCPL